MCILEDKDQLPVPRFYFFSKEKEKPEVYNTIITVHRRCWWSLFNLKYVSSRDISVSGSFNSSVSSFRANHKKSIVLMD